MKQNSTFLFNKLNVYIQAEQTQNEFMQRFLVDFLIAKALKSKQNLVQTNLLIRLVKSSRTYAELVENSLRSGLKRDSDSYDLNCELKFSEIVSYVANNWPGGAGDMTDLPSWDWESFLAANESKQ